MKSFRKFCVGLLGVVISLAVWADTINLSAQGAGNPTFTTQGDRNAAAYAAMYAVTSVNPPMTILNGDTLHITFTDGWTQDFEAAVGSDGTISLAPTGEVRSPQTYTGGGGTPTGCGSGGYYEPVWGTATVCTNGECTTTWYVDHYEWVPSTDVSTGC